MTLTLALNQNNDLYLDPNGNIAILQGINAVAGACETISRAQLGEMIFEQTQGIPNFQALWVGVPNYKLWQSYLRTALENVNGVRKIDNIEMQLENNVLSYTANITTIFGTTIVNG